MKPVKRLRVTCGKHASEFMLGRVSGMLSTINVNEYEFVLRKMEDDTWIITVEGFEDDCWAIRKHIETHYPGLCEFAFAGKNEK